MHPANRIAVNTGYLYARMAITIFVSLYATRLILGALGARDFGIFNVVGGAIAMLTFLNTSMASATQRFMSYALGAGDSERQKSIFNVSIVLHFVIAIIVVLILEVFGLFLFHGILNIQTDKIEVAKLIFQFMLLSTFFTIISVPYDAIINSNENMLLVTILGIIESFLKLAIAIYISKTSFDKLVSYGLLTAALSIFLLIIRRIYCHKAYEEAKINFKKYYKKELFKQMTSFAGWNFLGSSSSMVSNYGQGIIINMFFGTTANAAQGIASQVSGQLSVFAGMMMKALNPIIDKSEGAGDRNMMLRASMMGSKVSFFLLMFFFVPFLIETPYILKLWLKNIPPYVVIFCQLLLLRNLIEQLFVTLVSSIAAVGNIKRFQIFSAVLTIFPLLATYFFYKNGYPVYSIYIIFLIYSVLASLNIVYFSKVTFNLNVFVFFKNVVFRCFSSFSLVFLLSLIPAIMYPDGILRLVIVEIVNIISFVIIIWFWGFNKNEKESVGKTIFSLINNLLFKIKHSLKFIKNFHSVHNLF